MTRQAFAGRFREFLTDEGHDVRIAASAEEGLEIAGGGEIDAVVLDVRLPGIDGLTALRGFRQRVRPGTDHRRDGLRQSRNRGARDGGRCLRLPGEAIRSRSGRGRHPSSP